MRIETTNYEIENQKVCGLGAEISLPKNRVSVEMVIALIRQELNLIYYENIIISDNEIIADGTVILSVDKDIFTDSKYILPNQRDMTDYVINRLYPYIIQGILC